MFGDEGGGRVVARRIVADDAAGRPACRDLGCAGAIVDVDDRHHLMHRVMVYFVVYDYEAAVCDVGA